MLKPNSSSLKSLFSKRIIVTVAVLIILVASGIGIYIYSRMTEKPNLGFLNLDNNDNRQEEAEIEELVKSIGEKFLLPDEIPTIATVSDKSQLSGQSFFIKAENGDKVLIYTNAAIAILYRPSIGKIINVGPVNLDNGELTATSSAQIEPTEESEEGVEDVGVIILNGTTTVGLTQVAADDLAALEYVIVEDRDDAANKPYEATLVVVLNSDVVLQGEEIAAQFGAQVENSLPEGEQWDADIVIILGEDYASE